MKGLQQFLEKQAGDIQRIGTGYMADKPGTYKEGPESFGEAMAFAPTPLIAGAMGAKGAKSFGNALRNAKKYVPMLVDDIADAAPVLERYFNRDDPVYHIMGQRNSDEKMIKDLAGHYIGKDILKIHAKNPQEIARELVRRIMLDRTSIPR